MKARALTWASIPPNPDKRPWSTEGHNARVAADRAKRNAEADAWIAEVKARKVRK